MRMKVKLIGFLAAIFVTTMLVLGCGNESKTPEKDPLLGDWRVFYVDRGGTIIGGRKFHGTAYTFRENGTVFAETHKGDTVTSRFEHKGDTLKYLGNGVEESYHLDTLNNERLVMSAEIDGIPTEIRMMRRKK